MLFYRNIYGRLNKGSVSPRASMNTKKTQQLTILGLTAQSGEIYNYDYKPVFKDLA